MFLLTTACDGVGIANTSIEIARETNLLTVQRS